MEFGPDGTPVVLTDVTVVALATIEVEKAHFRDLREKSNVSIA